MAQCEDAAVQRVVTDDPPLPAQLDQLIPRRQSGSRLGERDKHLHHAGLQFAPIAICDHGTFRWEDSQLAELERWFMGQINPIGRR
jgi:hypothetical protein